MQPRSDVSFLIVYHPTTTSSLTPSTSFLTSSSCLSRSSIPLPTPLLLSHVIPPPAGLRRATSRS
eukprot:767434-Hanusia_phi.AAC.2